MFCGRSACSDTGGDQTTLGAATGFAPTDAAAGDGHEIELPCFAYQGVHLVPSTTFAQFLKHAGT